MVLDLTKKNSRTNTAVSTSSREKSKKDIKSRGEKSDPAFVTSLPSARDSAADAMFFTGGMIVASDAAAESREVSANVRFLSGVFLRRKISYLATGSWLLPWLIVFLSPTVIMGAFRFPKMLTLTSLAVDAVGCPHSEQKRESTGI